MRLLKCVVMVIACWVNVAWAGEFVGESASNRVSNVESNYYERVRSCIESKGSSTNCDLIDPSNNVSQVTNSVISVEDCKEGKVFGLRLGMTMSDAVAVIGKPNSFDQRFTKSIRLLYGNYLTLMLRNNRLSECYVKYYNISNLRPQDIRFSNGLTGASSMAHFLKSIGTPTRCHPNVCGHFRPSYTTVNRVFELYFSATQSNLYPNTVRENDEMAQQQAKLYAISIHFEGLKFPPFFGHVVKQRFC